MALTLAEYRKSYPQYDHIDDDTLTRALHKKYYAQHMSYDEFTSKLGAVSAEHIEEPEPSGPTPQELEDRAAQSMTKALADDPLASTGSFGGVLGFRTQPKDIEDRVKEEMAIRKRLVDLDIYPAERYKFTPEQFEALSEDRIQKAILEAQQKGEDDADGNIGDVLGVKAGVEPSKRAPESGPEREISEDAGWWRFTKESTSAVAPLVWTGAEGLARMHERMEAQDLSMGMVYIERIASDYENLALSKEAEGLIEEAAAKHGLTVNEYARYTATAVDIAFDREKDSMDEFAAIMEEVQKYKPRSADDTFLGHIAALAIENIQNVAYIAAGVITLTPATTMILMGTDIYTRTYMQARLDGRSTDDAVMDAFASAIIEGVTEGVPVGKFIRLMKAGNTGRAMKLLQGFGTEASQELLAEAAQIGYDLKVIGLEMSWGEAIARLRDAGILGGLMGVAIGGPVAVLGDNNMTNARTRVNKAKKALQSISNRVADPANKGTAPSESEVEGAVKEYAAALKEIKGLVAAKLEKKAGKKTDKVKKKAAKKEVKRAAKLTPKQRRQETAVKKQAKTDQKVVGKLTEADLKIADTIDKVANRTFDESDREAVKELIKLGYARITKTKEIVVLKHGQNRLKAIRKAQEAERAAEGAQAPVPAVPSVQKEQTVQKEPETLKDQVDNASYSDLQRLARDRGLPAGGTAVAVRERILKAEAQKVQKNLEALDEQKDKSGTKLGRVLREVEKKLRAEDAKARSEIDMDFWTKPNQGEMFSAGAAAAKGGKEYAKLVKVGALKLATHGAKYSAWAADMIGEFGENIRPILTSLYNDAKRNVKNVMKWSHEKFDKGPRKGELKFGPKPYAKPGAIAGLRRVLGKLAAEGASARMWYEKSGKAITNATGNEKDARLLSGLMAIYSTATGVGPNLTNALKMWAMYQSGNMTTAALVAKPIAGRFAKQDKMAIDWLTTEKGLPAVVDKGGIMDPEKTVGMTDEEFENRVGPKVFAFFTNLMREVDPKTYEYGQGVTVDIWMMRAFGYDVKSPTDSQNAFAAVELRALADKLGWEKQQVQAAVWVAIKARWSVITKSAQKLAVKRGLAELNPAPKGKDTFDVLGKTRQEQVENEKKIIMIFRAEAMKVSVDELTASLERSKQDFSDFLESQYATVSWEAEPSTKLGLVFNSMPIEDKILLQYEISQVLTNPETGREYLAEWLGLLGADQFNGPGAWDGAVGAVTQNKVLAPLQHGRSQAHHVIKTVQPESAEALDGYVAILGFLLRQDAVAWHRPFYGKAKKRANGVSLVMPYDMDAAKLHRDVVKLYSAIVAEAELQGYGEYTGLQWPPVVLNGEIRILNFQEDLVGNRAFHKVIRAAADKAGVGGAMETFQTDGNMVQNNWEENPKGESYETAISASQNKRVIKAFERAKRELAGRIDAVYEKYAEKYKAHRGPARVVVTKLDGSLKGQKLPALKKGMIRFRHFGKKLVGKLKPEFFGTGIKGAESQRGSEQVISAYPDKGFQKEIGLGQFEYVIDIVKDDLYDANNDPLKLRAKAQEPFGQGSRLNFTKYERLIKAAGFVGYYTPDASGNLKGQARFFYDLTVGPESTASQSLVPAAPTVRIVENQLDHFEVRDKDGKILEIEDPDEAIDKARSIYGKHTIVEIVDEHGNVIVTERPKVEAKPPTLTSIELSTGIPIDVLKKANVLAEIKRSMNELMDEFEEETTADPNNPDARIFNGGAAVELIQYEGSMLIRSLYSFEAGAGQGNAALKFIIELADKHGVSLELTAGPFDTDAVAATADDAADRGLDQRALIDWYMRNGFVRYKRGRTEDLVRLPQNVTGEFMRIKRPVHPTNAFMGPERRQVDDAVFKFRTELGLDFDTFDVVDSVEGLPDALYDMIAISGKGGLVQGAFHEDPIKGPTIYLVVNNIRALEPVLQLPGDLSGMDQAIQQLLLHETIGHFGLNALLGPKKYNQYMDQIIRAFPKDVNKQYRDIIKGLQGRRLAAEEVFAYMVQDELMGVDLSNIKITIIDKIIAEIRLLLMRLGWVKMNRNDLLALMWRSAEFTQKHDTSYLRKRAAKTKAMKRAELDLLRGEEAWGQKHETSFSITAAREEDEELDEAFNKIGMTKGIKWPRLRELWNNTFHNLKNRTEIALFDQFAGILHAEQELGIALIDGGYIGVRLSAGVDVIVRSALENGAPIWDKEGTAATDTNVKGLIEILAPIAQSDEMLEAFQMFIVARRAKRLKAEDRENLFTSANIEASLGLAESMGWTDLFEETAAEMAEFKSKVLDFAEEAGLINKEGRKLWEHHDHVPFYRVLLDKGKGGPFANARMGDVGKQIHRLFGGEEMLANPLTSIVENISVLIEASIKNRAAADVVRSFLGTGVITKIPNVKMKMELVPDSQVLSALKARGISLEAVDSELLNGVQEMLTLQKPEGDNIISVQENGKRQYYEVHDAGVMRGMDNVSPTQWHWLMKVLRFPKRIFTIAITRMPPFILKNWWRDMLHTWVLSRHGTIIPGYDSIKGWGKAIAEDATYKDILSGGGMFDAGYVNASDPATTQKAIKKQLLAAGRGNILDTVKKLAHFYIRIANGAENAHRIAVYEMTLKKTGSRKQALFESRDIMDFSVRGANPVVRFLAETVPFWSARVQGISRTYKGRHNKLALVLRGLPIVLATWALYAMNRDDDRYKALNDYEKRMYYHFYDFFEPGDHYRLPKPFEVGAIFSTIPEIGLEWMLSKEPDRGKTVGKALLFTFREQFGLMPAIQAFYPVFELIANKKYYTGAPVVSDFEKKLPAVDQFSARTSETVTAIAQALGWSPKKTEHLLKGYFATAYEYTVGAADIVFNSMQENKSPTLRKDEYLFVNAFVREEYGATDKYQQEMYAVLREADKWYNSVNRHKKLDTAEGDERVLEIEASREAELFARRKMNPARVEIRKINADIRRIDGHPTMSADRKREVIDKLMAQRRNEAISVYDYRPGGKKNPFTSDITKPTESYWDMLKGLTGMTKREQVDALISANLPHTATLINDVTIGLDKLKAAA